MFFKPLRQVDDRLAAATLNRFENSERNKLMYFSKKHGYGNAKYCKHLEKYIDDLCWRSTTWNHVSFKNYVVWPVLEQISNAYNVRWEICFTGVYIQYVDVSIVGFTLQNKTLINKSIIRQRKINNFLICSEVTLFM